ncbi:MAG: rRNA maturation RNase YbeY [Bacteroidota bacterium]
MISFISEDRNFSFNKTNLKNFIKELVLAEKFKAGDISIVLCSDEYLLEINKSYLDHDYFTDIITFDYSGGKTVSGDLMISLDRVEDNARQNKVDVLHEFHRVVFHGVLHLCGYKDKSPKDQALMRSKEDFYLQKFYAAN